MFIVYSDHQNEKKILEEEFLFHSNHFSVPPNNVKTLHDLIGSTCYQFFHNNQSVFIQKFKTFISGLIDMTFSFPLLRQLLAIAKRKDLTSQFYRSHFLAIDGFFHDGEDPSRLFQDQDRPKQMSMIAQQLQQSYFSYKALQTFEMDTEPIISLQSIAQSQQLAFQKQYFHQKDEKISIFLSDYTADETLETCSHTIDSHKMNFNIHTPSDTQTQAPPLKDKKTFQTNLFTMWDKNVSKGNKFIHQQTNQSLEEYINQFRKQKACGVVEMIINDQSLGKIARKQIREHKQRKKLEDQLMQKTKSLKNNEYNSKIKNILLNNKLNQKRSRSTSAFKKGRVPDLQNAKLIGKIEKDDSPCPQEKDFSFAKVNLKK